MAGLHRNDPDHKKASELDIDTKAPGQQGKRREFGLAGDARPDRAPGDSGRGDLSDTDRVGSHGQGIRPLDSEEDGGVE